MNLIILDLEWNAAYSRKLKGYINEIIEFGAVKCDEQLRIVDCFSSFVRLQVGKKINSVISNLTSIRDENLMGAMPFMQVVSRFKRWAGDAVILTWGTSDILTLIENCRYFSGSGQIPFLSRYGDLQRYCEKSLETGGKDQLGLAAAAQLVGVSVDGIAQHRALDDSLLSLEVLRKFWSQNSLEPFLEDARCEEFYKKMTFKTSIISDMNHPLVTKKSLKFLCEKCGGETRRLSKWQFKNKRFVSDFRCISCGYEFSGRIQLKEKYEGLVVNKKCVSLPKIEKPRKCEPGPIGSMCLQLNNGVGLLHFPRWQELSGVSHAFSTRIGGVSNGKFSAMNLGLGRGDNDSSVMENFNRIFAAMELNKELLVAGNQDHHCNVRRVSLADGGAGVYKEKFTESIDGLCTDEAGITLMVYCADCVPLYFYDPVKRCIGLAHAGWRGTVNGMARAMVEALSQNYGSRPEDLLVAVGPSISKECFQVDPPCAEEFLKLPESELFVEYSGEQKYQVDLWECNRRYLIWSGVRPGNITVGGVCSMCNSDLVFSHRVTKGQRGSNAAFLALT